MTKEKHGHGVGGGEVTTGLVECVEVLHGVWPCAVFEYRHSSDFMRANKCLCATEFVSNKETILPLLTATNQAACKPDTNGFTGRLGLTRMHALHAVEHFSVVQLIGCRLIKPSVRGMNVGFQAQLAFGIGQT